MQAEAAEPVRLPAVAPLPRQQTCLTSWYRWRSPRRSTTFGICLGHETPEVS
ncbi:TPA: hypothetical protein HIT98_004727 [Escherichia coli]|uniref:hypothetical protein n=1 Tax=Escherichia coli TaxID=562 RepID=UPI00175809BF|nr:hypothetical protein [Escherichia coli]EIY6704804.1 hypothetical protein [Escherichia coli]MCF7291760.1 hypothetical protein [Escherichia coli]MED0052189.1 hypothetical protein [Escherichia coli]HAI1527269.1 hypothetical protein [Escherichia coli]